MILLIVAFVSKYFLAKLTIKIQFHSILVSYNDFVKMQICEEHKYLMNLDEIYIMQSKLFYSTSNILIII